MSGESNIREIGHSTRFKKGQSGNPGGCPKGLSLLALLHKELEKPCSTTSKVKQKEMFVARCVQLALAGRPDMIRLIWEYVEGKPTQPVDHSGSLEVVTIEKIRQAIGIREVGA